MKRAFLLLLLLLFLIIACEKTAEFILDGARRIMLLMANDVDAIV